MNTCAGGAYNMEKSMFKSCYDGFKCKEYKVTCTSCETTGCLCNPNCSKCIHLNNGCKGTFVQRDKRPNN